MDRRPQPTMCGDFQAVSQERDDSPTIPTGKQAEMAMNQPDVFCPAIWNTNKQAFNREISKRTYKEYEWLTLKESIESFRQ